MIIKKQFSKKSIFSIDMKLCYEIYKKHPSCKNQSIYCVKQQNHQLEGKNLCDQQSGNDFTIVSVYKQWYAGWYLLLLVEKDKSHHSLFWENINCIDEAIIKIIEETKKDIYSSKNWIKND
jgi:hypothetical protein